MAEEALSRAGAFCEEYDDTLPRNNDKKINKKYITYLPLARWLQLAAQIALKQETLAKLSDELKESSTKAAILHAELNELKNMLDETQKDTESLRKTLKNIDQIYNQVFS